MANAFLRKVSALQDVVLKQVVDRDVSSLKLVATCIACEGKVSADAKPLSASHTRI